VTRLDAPYGQVFPGIAENPLLSGL